MSFKEYFLQGLVGFEESREGLKARKGSKLYFLLNINESFPENLVYEPII